MKEEERSIEKYIDQLGYAIYTVSKPRRIGQIVTLHTLVDGSRNLSQSFVVVREASLAEYQAYERGLQEYLGTKVTPLATHGYYYEVRTD